jgi:hypothetical protein
MLLGMINHDDEISYRIRHEAAGELHQLLKVPKKESKEDFIVIDKDDIIAYVIVHQEYTQLILRKRGNWEHLHQQVIEQFA